MSKTMRICRSLRTTLFLALLPLIVLGPRAPARGNYSPTTYSIIIISFTATYHSGQVLVEWETATEPDVIGFSLQRSLSTSGPFTEICWLPAVGEETIGAQYSCTDAAVVGGAIYYYRLRVFNQNGSSEYLGPDLGLHLRSRRRGRNPMRRVRRPGLTLQQHQWSWLVTQRWLADHRHAVQLVWCYV